MGRITRLANELFLRSPMFVRSAAVNFYGRRLARHRFGGEFPKMFAGLLESQCWPPEQMKAWQMERLRALLAEAAAHVPYYREMFRRLKLRPEDFREPDDLRQLPELTKDDIRRDSQMMVHEKRSKRAAVRDSTSGTTGQRLTFLLPRELKYSFNAATLWRAYDWAGVKLGARRVTIGPRWFTRRPPYWLYNRAENQLLLSIHHISPQTVDSYIDKIVEFAPALIQGQPNGIHLVAQRILACGRRVAVRAVSTTGETLEDWQRKDIEDAFQCRVFESYGLSESVIAAQQCCYGRFHEVSELGITEFVYEPSVGRHRVVGTSLWNDVMPFIRYRIEDYVELADGGECECGIRLPVRIRRIIGRTDDVLFTAEGHTVLPVTIRMSINPLLQEFESYQLQQVEAERYVFVFAGSLTKQRERIFRHTLEGILGRGAKIEIECGERIMEPSGKIRTVVNRSKPS